MNERTAELNQKLEETFPALAGSTITWKSPLADDGFKEYLGAAALKQLDLDRLTPELSAFWPKRGPQWDALAVVDAKNHTPTVILVEGKSHPDELLRGSPCRSKPGENRDLIEQSLRWARFRLGVSESFADAWTGPLYQSANRLAHHVWLRSLGVHSFFAHLLFTGDPKEPTTAEEWSEASELADERLGIAGRLPVGAGYLKLEAAA